MTAASLAPWLTATFDTAKQSPAASTATLGDDVFDALNPKGRRRTASTSQIKPEDLLLNGRRRDQMDANAQDVHRNFSLLQWMIRQTINYCTLFDFHPTTKDESLNKDLRFLMNRDCEPEQNDYVGRMSWDDMRSVAESLKIVAGDCHLIPLQEGTIQLVEGSYCRDPQDRKDKRWLNGARLNSRNRVVGWNFREHDMTATYGSQFTDREVPASRVWQHIQYEQRANLVRGLSTISAALNEMRDLYETMDLARAKIKLEQLFGIAIFRNPDDDEDIADAVSENGDAEDADPETAAEQYYDFGNGAPVVMNHTVGEKVEILQANSPGSNTIEFMRLCIQLVMLALDLPANFYNPSETNFFGSQAAWTLFERSCHRRRQSQLRLHKRMTRWRQWRWILPESLGGTGEIALPRGFDIDNLTYKWVPRGVPFWKPTEQLSAGLGRVAAGLTTMQGLCDETGSGLFEENLQNLRHELSKAEQLGFRMKINTARLDVTLEDILTAGKPSTAKSA